MDVNDSQRSSMIDRIQKEYDREKETAREGGHDGRPDVRSNLLIAEVLVEIDRSLQVFVDEFHRDRAEREAEEKKFEEEGGL